MIPQRAFHFRSILPAVAVLLILLGALLGGCSAEDSPVAVEPTSPPTLPAPDRMQFDFSFFEQGAALDKSRGQYDNFVNAYLRVAVLDIMAHVVLAAPVAAFSAAVHTVPVAQPDGAWQWTYDWQTGSGTVAVILRGLPAGEVVQWELSLLSVEYREGVLWFSGSTGGDGSEGHLVFRDLDDPDHPISGEIDWGQVPGGPYLEFVCHEPGAEGDTLRFTDTRPEYRVDFQPGDGGAPSWITWRAAGSGSLRVPDYNGGEPACWGIDLRNAECP